MERAKKEEFVGKLAGKLEGAQCVYLTDFTGLNVERMTQLRAKLRASAVEYVVVKNTLARRAIAGTPAAPLDELLEGPTAFALGQADVVAAAKVLADFAREANVPRIKGGVIAGRIVSLDEIQRIAALPGRDVLLAKLVGSMKSPLSGCVFVLSGLLSKFVRTVDALRAKKAEAAESGAGTAPGTGESAAPAASQQGPPEGGGAGEARPAGPAETEAASTAARH